MTQLRMAAQAKTAQKKKQPEDKRLLDASHALRDMPDAIGARSSDLAYSYVIARADGASAAACR